MGRKKLVLSLALALLILVARGVLADDPIANIDVGTDSPVGGDYQATVTVQTDGNGNLTYLDIENSTIPGLDDSQTYIGNVSSKKINSSYFNLTLNSFSSSKGGSITISYPICGSGWQSQYLTLSQVSRGDWNLEENGQAVNTFHLTAHVDLITFAGCFDSVSRGTEQSDS